MGYKITISKYIGIMTGRMVDQINVEGMSGDKLVWQHLLSITQND